MRVELRLGITVMLCHFARPASVDYRLQSERSEDGRLRMEDGGRRSDDRGPKDERQKTEAGDRRTEIRRQMLEVYISKCWTFNLFYVKPLMHSDGTKLILCNGSSKPCFVPVIV